MSRGYARVMTFSYDQAADALEISIRDNVYVDRTVELDSGTLVDVDRHGDAIAVEVLRPARQWPLEELLGRFRLSEEDTAMLRSLWGSDGSYAFGSPDNVLVA